MGVEVLPLGLGLAALGRPGYITLGHAEDLNSEYAPEEMEAQAHEVLEAAYAQGVRYYDAARSYGKAEQFLASWLQNNPKQDVLVGSKWGYTYTADWQVQAAQHEVKEHSLSVLLSQWKESQSKLGNHLRLYQIHSATQQSGVLSNPAVLDALEKMRDESGIRMGLSLSGVGQAQTLAQALTVERNGSLLFGTVQATFNVLEPSVMHTLEHAHQAGMQVIVKEVLANGRLTSRNTEASFGQKKNTLQAIATQHGVTIDAIALAWVLQHSFVDMALSGAATQPQLSMNLAALSVSLKESELAALSLMHEHPDAYWDYRAHLPWN